jgi:hypothetical protein
VSSTGLELVFEGQELESGRIDAGVLGSALAGYSEVFRRANQLVNGDASEAVVLVESNFKTGSFDVDLQLIQNVLENAKALITAHPFLNAAELAAAIGFLWSKRESLIKILKWLKGEKPERITQSGNNFEIVMFGQKRTVSNTVNLFLGDAQIRDALARAVQPLRHRGIERIQFRPKEVMEPKAEPTTIEKSEVEYFEREHLQLAADDALDAGERDTVLTISKLSFVEGPKWTFYERGATVIASIKDEEFWHNVHRRKYKFAEGDRLRVRLRWKMVEKGYKPKPENVVLTVYEVLQRAKQMRLDGARDDEVV